jgi:ATP synthase protein I
VAAGIGLVLVALPKMSEGGPSDPLTRLGERLDKARLERDRGQANASGDAVSPGGALGFGFRIGVELVAALCVGLALGWVAYRFLPAPWGTIGLIAFFFLGAGAGTLNVFRAAQGVGRKAD